MNLFVLWPFFAFSSLVWHWSDFLALWLPFIFVSNSVTLSSAMTGMAFSSDDSVVVNNLCTNHLYYCTQLHCTTGQLWTTVALCPRTLALQEGRGKKCGVTVLIIFRG